jgi:hypothetical protein
MISRKLSFEKAVVLIVQEIGLQYRAADRCGNTTNSPAWLEARDGADKQECDDGGADTAPPLVDELLSHFMARPPGKNADPLFYRPIITSRLIAQIKALPQWPNKAFLVVKDESDSLKDALTLAGLRWVSFY